MSKLQKVTGAEKPEVKAENQPANMIEKVDELSELKNQIEKLKQENDSLKVGKLKLDFKEAERLYKRKSELIKTLHRYNELLAFFKSLKVTTSENDVFNADNVRLSFEEKAEYDRYKNVFATSSAFIISEFVPMIIKKLDGKIEASKIEIETIDI